MIFTFIYIYAKYRVLRNIEVSFDNLPHSHNQRKYSFRILKERPHTFSDFLDCQVFISEKVLVFLISWTVRFLLFGQFFFSDFLDCQVLISWMFLVLSFPGLPGFNFLDSFPSLISWTARFFSRTVFFYFPFLSASTCFVQ